MKQQQEDPWSKPNLKTATSNFTGIVEVADSGRVGIMERARPPVPEPHLVGPRAHGCQISPGRRRQQIHHRRRRSARQIILRRTTSQFIRAQILLYFKLQSNMAIKPHLCNFADHVVALLSPCLCGAGCCRCEQEKGVEKKEGLHLLLPFLLPPPPPSRSILYRLSALSFIVNYH